MTFRAYMSEARYVKHAFSSVGKVVEEAPLIVNEEGIFSRAMDASHIAMAVLKMPDTMFEEYEAPEEELVYGLDMEEVTRIMRRARVTEEIELAGEDESELIIRITRSGYTREFRIRSLDIPDIPDEPQLDFPVEVVTTPDFVEDAVRDAELFSDTVKFHADENEFYMLAEGERGKAKPTATGEALLGINVDEPAECAYPLDYLKDMLDAAKGAESVIIRFGTDQPLQMTFKIGPAGEGTLTFYLAPRTE